MLLVLFCISVRNACGLLEMLLTFGGEHGRVGGTKSLIRLEEGIGRVEFKLWNVNIVKRIDDRVRCLELMRRSNVSGLFSCNLSPGLLAPQPATLAVGVCCGS